MRLRLATALIERSRSPRWPTTSALMARHRAAGLRQDLAAELHGMASPHRYLQDQRIIAIGEQLPRSADAHERMIDRREAQAGDGSHPDVGVEIVRQRLEFEARDLAAELLAGNGEPGAVG